MDIQRDKSVTMMWFAHLVDLGVIGLGCGLGFRVGVASGWREKCRTHQKQQEGRGRGRVHLCDRGRKGSVNLRHILLGTVLKVRLVN